GGQHAKRQSEHERGDGDDYAFGHHESPLNSGSRCRNSSYSTAVCDDHHSFGEKHLLALLRVRRERPRRRAAERRDERAPPHSITLSAVASSLSGTVRPSIFAVRALMTRLEFGRLHHRQVGRFLALGRRGGLSDGRAHPNWLGKRRYRAFRQGYRE